MKALSSEQLAAFGAMHTSECALLRSVKRPPCDCGFHQFVEDNIQQAIEEIVEMREKYKLLLRSASSPPIHTNSLSEAEILIVMRALKPPEGGYSKDETTARLQARLSIMLAVEEKLRQVRRDGNN